MSEPTLAEALEAVRSIVSSIQSEASEFRAGVHPPQRTVVIPEGQYRSAKAALPVIARAVEREKGMTGIMMVGREKVVVLYRRLAEAQARLLVAYRLGRHPGGKVLDNITRYRAELIDMGEEPKV